MKILLLDTCGKEGSVAIADTTLLAQAFLPDRTSSERIVAAIRSLLDEAAWKPRDLEAIAVVTGPGSFTGVRVGLSAAMGLGEATGAPVIPISRLAILAAAAQAKDVEVCALLDAGRKELYYGRYRNETCLEESILTLSEAISAASTAGAFIACEPTVFEALSLASLPTQATLVDEPTAAAALPFALKGLQQDGLNTQDLEANYLRKTDAEIFAKQATTPSP